MNDRKWWQGVQVEDGGWMRLEDFCNSTERGNQLHITSGILFMEEELLGCELGWRVANEIIGLAVDGWDALMDAAYLEYLRGEHEEGSSNWRHAHGHERGVQCGDPDGEEEQLLVDHPVR